MCCACSVAAKSVRTARCAIDFIIIFTIISIEGVKMLSVVSVWCLCAVHGMRSTVHSFVSFLLLSYHIIYDRCCCCLTVPRARVQRVHFDGGMGAVWFLL